MRNFNVVSLSETSQMQAQEIAGTRRATAGRHLGLVATGEWFGEEHYDTSLYEGGAMPSVNFAQGGKVYSMVEELLPELPTRPGVMGANTRVNAWPSQLPEGF